MRPLAVRARVTAVRRMARLTAPARRLAGRVRAALGSSAWRRWRAKYVVVDWIGQTGASALTALGLAACTEAVSKAAFLLHVHGPGWGLGHRVTPDAFETFVATVTGALAALLALFFTTVGVVAATAYANVPTEVRAAFLRGRHNAVFVATIMRALVVGMALLAAHTVGYHPYALTVMLFALLSLLSVLGTASLSVSLLRFFDSAAIAEPLPGEFIDAVARASVPPGGSRPAPAEQAAAHEAAERALRLRRQVLALIVKRDEVAEAAPAKLLETIRMWDLYSQHKPAIPTGSAWYSRQVQETNWLTVNPFDLRDPVTQAPVSLKVAPDTMWIERELTGQFISILRPLVQAEGWASASETITATALVTGRLTADLNIEEALLLCQAASSVIDHALDAQTTIGDQAPDRLQSRRFRTAAVQAGTSVRAQMWRGLSTAAHLAGAADLGEQLERAAHTPNDPEATASLPIPRNLRSMLDAMAAGLAIERDAEDREISPGWWLRHLTAHTLARALFATADVLLDDLHAYLTARHRAVTELNDTEALVTLLLGGLEMVDRAAAAVEDVLEAGRHLAKLEPAQHSYEEPWPVWEPDLKALAQRRGEVLRALAPKAAMLPARPHAGDAHDLLGHSYDVIAQALFEAVLKNDKETAAVLFPAAMQLAESAQTRVTADVSEQPMINHLISAVGPVIDMMLIGGYALFLDAFDGSGIWPQVQAHWDQVTATADTTRALVAMLEARHQRVAGDAKRMPWQTAFGAWLEEHGLGDGPVAAIPGQRRRRAAYDPVVEAVLEVGPMSTYLMADLFRLEYLATRPGGQQQAREHGSHALRDRLARVRRTRQQDAEMSESD